MNTARRIRLSGTVFLAMAVMSLATSVGTAQAEAGRLHIAGWMHASTCGTSPVDTLAAPGSFLCLGRSRGPALDGPVAPEICPPTETRCPAWTTRFDHAAGHDGEGVDALSAIVAAPDGATVFVTGGSWDPVTSEDIVTLALDPATGSTKWTSRYDAGLGSWWNAEFPTAMAVSYDGRRVYVVGLQKGHNYSGAYPAPLDGSFAAEIDLRVSDFVVLALDAATGSLLWSAPWEGPIPFDPEKDVYPNYGTDIPFGIAVSPDGATIVAVGTSRDLQTSYDETTVALDAETGALLWQSREDAGQRAADESYVPAFAPDGERVFVAGWGYPEPEAARDVLVSARDVETGDEVWRSRYEGPSDGGDYVFDAATDGELLYLAGQRDVGTATVSDALIVALDATTGEPRWDRSGGGPGFDFALDLALVSGRLLVAGGQEIGTADGGVTEALAARSFVASSGDPVWTKLVTPPDPFYGIARGLAPGPDGTVYLAGTFTTSMSYLAGFYLQEPHLGTIDPTVADLALVSLDGDTGAERWTARFNGMGGGGVERSTGVAVARGMPVLGGWVTRPADPEGNLTDFDIVAYGP